MIDFINYAIQGSMIYKEYLKERGLGTVEIKVNSKRFRKGAYELILEGRPVVLDALQVRIGNVLYSPKQIKMHSFNNKDKVLRVLPDEEARWELQNAEVANITLVSDLTFLVERVQKWYEKEENTERLWIPNDIPEVQIPNCRDFTDIPSDNQNAAIVGVLRSPFSYVWGAPGTGKTRFVLARCIWAYLQENKKVLIIGPTNNAVDQMLRGILPVLKETGYNYKKHVIRLGIPSYEFLQEYPEICENPDFERQRELLNQSIIDLKTKINAYEKQIEQYERELLQYNIFLSYEKNLKKCEDELPELFSTWIEHEKEKANCETEIKIMEGQQKEKQVRIREKKNEKKRIADLVQRRTYEVEKYSARWRRILHSKHYENCVQELERSNEQATRLQNEIGTLISEVTQIEEMVNGYRGQIETHRQEMVGLQKRIDDLTEFWIDTKNENKLQMACQQLLRKENVSMQALSTLLHEYTLMLYPKKKKYESLPERETIYQKLEEQRKLLQSLQDEMNRLDEKNSLKAVDCKLIAVTIDTCLSRIRPDSDSKFAHIFLDEAGYCSLIKGATLLAFDCPVTFLGDHYQLPPVCEMKDEDIEKNPSVALWASSALYTEIALRDMQKLREVCFKKQIPIFLDMQQFDLLRSYRFGDALAKTLNDNVYHKPGFCGTDSYETEIYYVDAFKEGDDGKLVSTGEAAAIKEYVKEHPGEDIGVLTLYRNQRKKLVSVMPSFESIMTVHASQGREWDTVLLSVVDQPFKHMWFADSTNKKSNGLNILNTALSRARKKIVIICDCGAWMKL